MTDPSPRLVASVVLNRPDEAKPEHFVLMVDDVRDAHHALVRDAILSGVSLTWVTSMIGFFHVIS
jgi:hypothetical protein